MKVVDLKEKQLIVLIIISLFIRLPSLRGEFIYDDFLLIVNNKYIKDIKYLSDIFLKNIGGVYRPLRLLSLLIDFKISIDFI